MLKSKYIWTDNSFKTLDFDDIYSNKLNIISPSGKLIKYLEDLVI